MPKLDKASEYKQPNRFQRFFRETIAELRKVNWPTWQEARSLTIVVLIVTVGMAIILGSLDLIFSRLFGLILG